MKVTRCKVYDLYESIIASGYPMLASYVAEQAEKDSEQLKLLYAFYNESKCKSNKHMMRAIKLANTPAGSGHGNFLSGIIVSFDVTATNAWWMQFERYHFAQIVSSMSKMHRIKQLMASASTESGVNPKTNFEFAHKYKDSDDIEELVYNCPMGLELTARVTTNYLQLKTIYAQRCTHRLREWRDFCKHIESLPFADYLITGKYNG